MKKLLAALILVLFMTGGAFAANAVAHGPGFLRLTLDSDFVWTTAAVTVGDSVGSKLNDLYPRGLALTAIVAKANAANDTYAVRLNSVTGPVLFDGKIIDGGSQCKYFDGDFLYKPYVEFDDLVAGVVITFYFSNTR